MSSETGVRPLRVGIVGAGFISQFQLSALSRLGAAKVVAVCDPVKARAEAMASRWSIEQSFDSVDDMLRQSSLDVVHILAPPSQHAPIALRCVAAGAHLFVEKPVTTSAADARMLFEAARRADRQIGVNHNLLFHPAFTRLTQAIRKWRFGRVRHVAATWRVPLRQLESKQFDSWMFASTGNIILEQAIHPLSVIAFLVGSPQSVSVLPSSAQTLPNGVRFVENWDVSMVCERGTATLALSFGRGFPATAVAVYGDDAVGTVDFRLNTFAATGHSRFSPPLNEIAQTASLAGAVSRDTLLNLAARAMQVLKFKPDVFTQTIEASVRHFYGGLNAGADRGADARHAGLIQTCEDIGAGAHAEIPREVQLT